jgi:hypothetical protein
MNRPGTLRAWIGLWLLMATVFFTAAPVLAAGPSAGETIDFPRDLQSYGDSQKRDIGSILKHRIQAEPFNLAATLIFLGAILHTFLAGYFMAIAHKWEHVHAERIRKGQRNPRAIHLGAELFHFLGEVEVVFGLWAIATVGAITVFYDWQTTVAYLTGRVNFTEPVFVVVIMTLAATRPIIKLTEHSLWKIADLLGGGLAAWWVTILTLGPVIGSLITEPAAMTISALLLSEKFYALMPSRRLKYATIGLLFVNISVGGTLSHFAAPPVLMVAGPWGWGFTHMLLSFGWKAVLGILVSNTIYFLIFRKELTRLQHRFAVRSIQDTLQKEFLQRGDLEREFQKMVSALGQDMGVTEKLGLKVEEMAEKIKVGLETMYLPRMKQKEHDQALLQEAFDLRFEEIKLLCLRKMLPGLLPEDKRAPFIDPDWDRRDDPVPVWITLVHVGFLAWTVANAHHAELFVPGLLFFLGFAEATAPFQNRINLKPPLLVGFFLGGLVIHGGVQGWWIAPVLGSLGEIPLILIATILTAFNDNAAITFLSTLVPGFTDGLKYAVVAGAVTGGGLTVIANAPNPAGQSILKVHFENGIAPGGLLMAALLPTAVVGFVFLILR